MSKLLARTRVLADIPSFVSDRSLPPVGWQSEEPNPDSGFDLHSGTPPLRFVFPERKLPRTPVH